MKQYKSNGDGKFEIEVVEPKETTKVKIRITHLMPSYSDVNIFCGDSSTTYPFIIGHSAIGVVSDDRKEYGLKRGTKVILNPYKSSNGSDEESGITTRGIDSDGFMREFVFVDPDKIVAFPEEVDEEDAIFTDRIALALKALNSCKLEKGDYVVILGGDSVCNIIAQLAIYFQLIPIMIDSNEEHLARATSCGVYYTVNETKESAKEKVAEITCGRMAEATIIVMNPELIPTFVFPLTKVGGQCVIACENKIQKSFEADISTVSRRRLSVKGINNGSGEFDSAVNIIAQKILKLEDFIEKTVEIKDAEVLLREMNSDRERYFSAVIKL